MLKSFDILIGFSVVMLITSMAVTVLTQIWTAIFNTRGTHLRDGLANLLNQLHCAVSMGDAKAIADHILMHPLIRDGQKRLGSLIHRDELIRLLLEAASAENLPERARKALSAALSSGGIEDPQAALLKIRGQALALEATSPALSNAARHDLAILQGAGSEFVAKVNAWFDRSMDRVSGHFTLTTRRITLINSVIVALAIQMDAVSLVNRLAGDDALRSALIEKAHSQKAETLSLSQITYLANHDLLPVPASPREWCNAWRFSRLPGFLLSILLLSLGAPFWFEALKNVLRLRGAIEGKDRSAAFTAGYKRFS